MITKRIDQLVYADIEDLVQRQVPEGRGLDYKRELPGRTDNDVKEFLKDVSSFANASGGHLIYGVTTKKIAGENTSIPDEIVGLGSINEEAETLRLSQLIRDGIQPRLTSFQVQPIKGADKTVVIIHIPSSWNAPHMVAKMTTPFYSRTSTGKHGLDATEIRYAFSMSESVGERIKAFRDERIGRILAGETPVPINPDAVVVVHCIPLEAFREKTAIELEALISASGGLHPIGVSGWDKRSNLDGVIMFSQPKGERAIGYVQVFRNGVVESVNAEVLSVNGETKLIPITYFENKIVEHCNQIVALLHKLDLDSPRVVFISLLNVQGYRLPSEHGCRPYGYPIDRKHLLLPDVLINDVSTPAEIFLKSSFDLIWQACGNKRSPHYDKDGNWLGQQ